MGVMECNRRGCDGIMCDRHSSEYGYICYECFDEIVTIQKGKPSLEFYDVEKFMNTPKNNFTLCEDELIDLDALFEICR